MTHKSNGRRTHLRDGFCDGFQPTKPLDLATIKTIDDLVRQMNDTAFGGRTVGEAATVLEMMVADPECFVVGTFSGAMTVAKMGLVLCDMIDHGFIDCVISTGALMTHGLIEATGMQHFKYFREMNDAELYQAGYDRVYDTLELEKNLDDSERIVDAILACINLTEQTTSSRKLCAEIGRYLHEHEKGRGILKSAFLKKVPVFIPAFTDSELGLDIALYNRRLTAQNKPPLIFDPFLDLEEYTEIIRKKKKLGVFTIGGGVPRNWAQQVGPYLDIIDKRIGSGGGFQRFQYGVRICPEPAYWGGLSGCTYSEGVTWGKFLPTSEGGRYAEVLADATIAWPLIVGAVLERMKKRREEKKK